MDNLNCLDYITYDNLLRLPFLDHHHTWIPKYSLVGLATHNTPTNDRGLHTPCFQPKSVNHITSLPNVTNILPQTKVVVTSSSNNSSVSVFQTTTKTKPNRRWVKRNVYKRKQTLFNTSNATVINLSSHILTDPQTQLLSRNLNFCPTPYHINHIELSEDIHRFCRRLRLSEFFYDEENTKPRAPLPSFFQKPSSFTPSAGRDKALDAFIKAVTKDLMTCQPRKCFPNIRTEEKRALKELKNNADKGGAVVVLNTTDYIAECTRQLSNATHYRKLNSDPTKKYNKRISDGLEIGVRSGEIDSDTEKPLIVPHPVPGRFYILPKIHKEGNLGRPIISGNGCPTEIISLFVDYHLKDLVRLVPS
ncbi:flagellar protein flil [Plakobranchus ocellatus]|uniref:Flagellar protein flil n=1 Tax=Plakobranchus ocellatus TaxID=259542 RepID=A0AAV3XU51_9GAST|nr:flagellar protein flil [Plakobranchus ocellatus]